MAVNSPVLVTQLYATRSQSTHEEHHSSLSSQLGAIPILPSIHDHRTSLAATIGGPSKRTSVVRHQTLAGARRGPRIAAGGFSQLHHHKFQPKTLGQTINKDGSMTPTSAVTRFRRIMTDYELEEIQKYSKIWFVGPTAQKLKCRAQDTTLRNFGYDNEKGRYQVIRNDHIAYRFEIIKFLGKGSFGDVMKVYDHQKKEYCALKIIRNEPRFHQQAQLEIKILDLLTKKDVLNRMNMIHMKEHFVFRGHTCITFELLRGDLYSELKKTGMRGFAEERIRGLTRGIVNSLRNLRRSKIVHCDLKPENILLDGEDQIKVIDFGSSCFAKDQAHTYIQSRFYRAPEIILGVFPYGCPIDMWSLGCIVVELFTGKPLFPGHCEAEQLMYHVEYLGRPPTSVLKQSKRIGAFFTDDMKLKPVKDRRGKTKPQKKRSLDDALNRATNPDFVDFIKRCLVWDPEKRMTPREASRHPFLTGRSPQTEHEGAAVVAEAALLGAQVQRRRSEPPQMPPTNSAATAIPVACLVTSNANSNTPKSHLVRAHASSNPHPDTITSQPKPPKMARSHSNNAVSDCTTRELVYSRNHASGSKLFGSSTSNTTSTVAKPDPPPPTTTTTTTMTMTTMRYPPSHQVQATATTTPHAARTTPRLHAITESL